jgi:hypothetical protein
VSIPSVREPIAHTTNESPGVPGLRTFNSPHFRIVVAVVLLAIGATLVAGLLVAQASEEDGQFAIDFGDYFVAAERMVAGETPYAAEMLAGPTDAQGVDRYRYPPLLADALRPLTALGSTSASVVWFWLQLAALYAAVWVGTGIGGARRSVERGLWCGVAVLFFLPAFDTLWKGNVGGFLALTSVIVALGGTAAGVGAGLGALLKSVPGTLVPMALVSDRRSRLAVILTIAIPVALSFAVSPTAWLDYPTVVLNMLGGSSDYASNLAPAMLAGRAGVPELGADFVRMASLLIALASVAGSVWLGRTREGLPAAALLGVIAMLLIPASLWYHYLVVLLPFAAIAWPRASSWMRTILLAGAAAVTVGLVWLPLTLAAGAILAVSSLAVIWPRGASSRLPGPAVEHAV